MPTLDLLYGLSAMNERRLSYDSLNSLMRWRNRENSYTASQFPEIHDRSVIPCRLCQVLCRSYPRLYPFRKLWSPAKTARDFSARLHVPSFITIPIPLQDSQQPSID